jgi:hypothetical protein
MKRTRKEEEESASIEISLKGEFILTTYQIPIVAGVFEEETQAKSAVDALRSAEFGRDQIGVAMQNSGPEIEHLDQDLVNLGVDEKRAAFYQEECKAGHIVVSVRPDGRDDVAKTILVENGAHDYQQDEEREEAGDAGEGGQYQN